MPEFNFTKEDVEFVYNLLRKGTIQWSGRAEILKLSRKKVLIRRSKTSGKPVYKYHWQCSHCLKWYRNEADMEVDHIKEIGGVTSFNGDWNEMIFKIMPRPVSEFLQVLCIACHMKKTGAFNSAQSRWKRKGR